MSQFIPLIAAFVALFGIYLKISVDRREEESRTSKIVWAEFDDIARHYNRNVFRLRAMRFFLLEKSMWPDINHVEKLKWPESTFIFSEERVKLSTISTVKNIYKMRLRLRNANLDADAAIRAFRTGDKDIFSKAIDFVESRHGRIEELAMEFTRRADKREQLSPQDERASFEGTKDMLFYSKPIAIES